jgi:hypothetical protein
VRTRLIKRRISSITKSSAGRGRARHRTGGLVHRATARARPPGCDAITTRPPCRPITKAITRDQRLASGPHPGEPTPQEVREEGTKFCVGTPSDCIRFLELYEALGIEEAILLCAVGPAQHEEVLHTLRLFEQVIRTSRPRSCGLKWAPAAHSRSRVLRHTSRRAGEKSLSALQGGEGRPTPRAWEGEVGDGDHSEPPPHPGPLRPGGGEGDTVSSAAPLTAIR